MPPMHMKGCQIIFRWIDGVIYPGYVSNSYFCPASMNVHFFCMIHNNVQMKASYIFNAAIPISVTLSNGINHSVLLNIDITSALHR